MFFDLNIPLPVPALLANYVSHSKQKQSGEPPCLFSAIQIAALETRVDLLTHLGYTILALSQVCQSKVDAKTHVDHISGLIPKLKKRSGIQLLKRLTVVLDEASEKGNGVSLQNTAVFSSYDILSVRPFTSATFSAACLTHSVASQTTAHIISIPISHSARLPYYLKHTLVRTAIANGVVFEVDYAGALTSDESERKFWWGGLREVIRATKGESLLLSGGIQIDKDARAPRDAANLIALAGLPQNLSHNAISQTAKTVVLRAQSRKTYRSVLSEPTLIMPPGVPDSTITPVLQVGTAIENTQEPKSAVKETTAEASSTGVPTQEGATNNGQSDQAGLKLPISDEIQRQQSNMIDQPESQTSHETPKQPSKSQPSQPSQTKSSKQKRKDQDKDHPNDNFGKDASTAIGETSNMRKRPRADSDQRTKQKLAAPQISGVGNVSSDGRVKKKKKNN